MEWNEESKAMKKLLFLVLLAGCSKPNRYQVVSSFDEIVLETHDKAKAHEAAQNLTSMGRILSSKPVYFVIPVNNRKSGRAEN